MRVDEARQCPDAFILTVIKAAHKTAIFRSAPHPHENISSKKHLSHLCRCHRDANKNLESGAAKNTPILMAF